MRGKMETYLTTKGLSEYLKIPQQSIRRWVMNDEIPYCRIHRVKAYMAGKKRRTYYMIANNTALVLPRHFQYSPLFTSLLFTKKAVLTAKTDMEKRLTINLTYFSQ
jgi:hypothetical protein